MHKITEQEKEEIQSQISELTKKIEYRRNCLTPAFSHVRRKRRLLAESAAILSLQEQEIFELKKKLTIAAPPE